MKSSGHQSQGTIFLSYSREDVAVAHLLALILEDRRIKVLMDDALTPGLHFPEGVQRMIRDSDKVLVLLTKSALNSIWVQQEIGFAIGIGKLVLPLATDKDIHAGGMDSLTQTVTVLDWREPQETIRSLVKLIVDPSVAVSLFRESGLDQIVVGRLERTRLITGLLTEIISEKCKTEICVQAAFSSFSISDDPIYSDQPSEYRELLNEERRLFDKLVKTPTSSLKLILWPVRNYRDRYLQASFRTLVRWLEGTGMRKPEISFVCAEYDGANQIIVETKSSKFSGVSIEGSRHDLKPGFPLNIVQYHRSDIAAAVSNFNLTFDAVTQTKEEAVRKIKQIAANHGIVIP